VNPSLTALRRIAIFGGSGSGKTTFARRLGKCLRSPVYHLDDIFHGPNWEEMEDHKFKSEVSAIVQDERWIIDGNYTVVRPVVMKWATFVILLRLPLYISLWRIFWRTISRNTRFKLQEVTPLPAKVEQSGVGEKPLQAIGILSKYSTRFYFRKFYTILQEVKATKETRSFTIIRSQKSIERFLYLIKMVKSKP
jgi:adenylate kinase family enzyme